MPKEAGVYRVGPIDDALIYRVRRQSTNETANSKIFL